MEKQYSSKISFRIGLTLIILVILKTGIGLFQVVESCIDSPFAISKGCLNTSTYIMLFGNLIALGLGIRQCSRIYIDLQNNVLKKGALAAGIFLWAIWFIFALVSFVT